MSGQLPFAEMNMFNVPLWFLRASITGAKTPMEGRFRWFIALEGRPTGCSEFQDSPTIRRPASSSFLMGNEGPPHTQLGGSQPSGSSFLAF